MYDQAYNFSFTFGFDSNNKDRAASFISSVATLISEEFGGCNIQPGTGMWAEEGHKDKPLYDRDNVESECSVTVSVTIPTSDPKVVTRTIRALIRDLAEHKSPPMKWVHHEVTDVKTHHFEM